MKRAFVYVMLATMLFNGSNLSVRNVQAAENSVISFLSNEDGNFDIFLIDTQGTVSQSTCNGCNEKKFAHMFPERLSFCLFI